jgi:hypothetical protein
VRLLLRRWRPGLRPNLRDSVAVRCRWDEKPLAQAISAMDAFEFSNTSHAQAIRFSMMRLDGQRPVRTLAQAVSAPVMPAIGRSYYQVDRVDQPLGISVRRW